LWQSLLQFVTESELQHSSSVNLLFASSTSVLTGAELTACAELSSAPVSGTIPYGIFRWHHPFKDSYALER